MLQWPCEQLATLATAPRICLARRSQSFGGHELSSSVCASTRGWQGCAGGSSLWAPLLRHGRSSICSSPAQLRAVAGTAGRQASARASSLPSSARKTSCLAFFRAAVLLLLPWRRSTPLCSCCLLLWRRSLRSLCASGGQQTLPVSLRLRARIAGCGLLVRPGMRHGRRAPCASVARRHMLKRRLSASPRL